MAQPGLVKITQENFAAGAWQSVARHLIPSAGVYAITNGLLTDDGSIYRRGGSERLSNAAFGASLRWIWRGTLSPGSRTIFASPSAFGVLDVDGLTPLSLGGAGLASPVRAVVIGDLLFLDSGDVYGGSRKGAAYSAGTVTTTNGSAVVTGATTVWNTNADAGMLFRRSGERIYVVKSVDSATQITLTEPYQGTGGAGQAYTLKPLETMSSPYKVPGIIDTIFNRLLVANGNRLDFSDGISATTPFATQPHSFAANSFHQLGAGVEILGLAALRDVELIFTTAGMWALTGMAYNITDASGNIQQRLENANKDLILWGREGIATWGNQLVVPAVDGIYTVGVVTGPEEISRSIKQRYIGYVRAGHHPGVATTYKSHYFLPILDSSNAVVDQLVCRLDRPVKSQLGVSFPWSFFDGHGGNVAAFATSVGGSGSARSPELLGAGRSSDARVLKLGGFFEPTAARKNDADGTTHIWQVETRDFATGPGNENTVRRLQARYELVDAASDTPTITALYSKGSENPGVIHYDDTAATYDDVSYEGDDVEFLVPNLLGSTAAPVDNGRNPYTWHMAARCLYIRGRLVCANPCASLVLRSVTWWVLASGRQ